tara:strand:- start:35 stop:223 length:189 start_codon:yes stop_codon:yes gene_type:complete
MSDKLRVINANLELFVEEMKAQGTWDSTTIITVSEFGRSLTSNGQGTVSTAATLTCKTLPVE